MSDVQLDITGILKAHRPNTQRAWVLLDPGLRDDHKAAVASLETATIRLDALNSEDDRKGLTKEIHVAEQALEADEAIVDALEETIAAVRVEFVFESIGREAYGKLLDENKPREGDADDEELGFNIDTFPPRLFALTCVNPKMNLTQAKKIWNTWGDTETTLLLTKAVVANKELVDIPFTRSGTKMEMLTTALQSTTPPAAESPTPSS